MKDFPKKLSPEDIHELDSFHARKSKAEEDAEEFVKKSPNEKGEEMHLEQIKSRFSPFLTETFTKWYDKETAEKVEQKLAVIAPEDIDWKTLKDDIDATKFGEYTLNPETMSINWENIPKEKIKVLDLQEMVGKSRAEVAEYVIKKYGATNHIPGIEYWEYIIQNPDKVPASLKDFNYYFFFGSMFRYQDGYVLVPCTFWNGAEFRRSAYRLGHDWFSNYRVVLLEK